ncbi:TatD family hydrolase [Alicyclobacillus sp. SO9]|uniref:TatD family hydrolase n=1 Tax=Alicyclobacillus sp. SO9 TaxID=2665646 RepID=UPI0018E78EB0|nr:TatD family hydrolase [Alicyclobacillus sp. SO9]QQE79390.1 TatD family hydrolase [Alicyclobacillus sp. SO9]
MLFDSHCHLFDEQFQEDLDAVMKRAADAGVTRFVVPAVDAKSASMAIRLAERFDGVYAAAGLHPESLEDIKEEEFQRIEELTQEEKVVAVGEIGLDYHWDVAPRDVQMDVFRRQLRLAKKVNLPVIIHNREATDDTVRILEEEASDGRLRGVMHCFTGSIETARRCMNFGFYISFGGPVTFKNAKNVQATAAQVPLDRLLVETDSPYLSPHPHRGKRNEPAQVRLVAEKLAELHGVSLEDLSNTTAANAAQLFGVK